MALVTACYLQTPQSLCERLSAGGVECIRCLRVSLSSCDQADVEVSGVVEHRAPAAAAPVDRDIFCLTALEVDLVTEVLRTSDDDGQLVSPQTKGVTVARHREKCFVECQPKRRIRRPELDQRPQFRRGTRRSRPALVTAVQGRFHRHGRNCEQAVRTRRARSRFAVPPPPTDQTLRGGRIVQGRPIPDWAACTVPT